MTFSAEAMAWVVAHLERAYPREGCGVVVEDALKRQRVVPMPNLAVGRRSYRLDAVALLGLLRSLDDDTERLACIFHSHCDAEATFSAVDRAEALIDGRPAFPGVSYLVVAVHSGRAVNASAFDWAESEFRASPVPLN